MSESTSRDSIHQHRLVFLGYLQGEYGGSYPLRQCLDCGATFEDLPVGKMAALYPTWTRERAQAGSESFDYVPDPKRSTSTLVLGKKLKDILAARVEPGEKFKQILRKDTLDE